MTIDRKKNISRLTVVVPIEVEEWMKKIKSRLGSKAGYSLMVRRGIRLLIHEVREKGAYQALFGEPVVHPTHKDLK